MINWVSKKKIKGEVMPDSYTEINKISYGDNIKNSFGGMILGIILFLASFVVLWINEGHNVNQTYKANYMDKNTVNVTVDRMSRDNDNKLVYLSGIAITDAVLTDGMITVPNAFALKRTVEMYQWHEEVDTKKKDEIGGSTTETKTYTYKKVWSEDEIDSENFKKPGYNNPKFPVKSADFYAETGKLGAFNLTTRQSKSMGGYLKYTNLPQVYGYDLIKDFYYKGEPRVPKVGDIKISYEYIPSGVEISIIGQQKSDNTLTNLILKKTSVYLQQDGLRTKDEMINSFRKGNAMFTNIIRILGWFLMFLGLSMLINPLLVILKIIPFFEKIVGFFTGGIIFLISAALSLLTIAIAWLAYRPGLSVGLLTIVGVIFFMVKKKLKPAKDANEEPQEELEL